MLANHALARRLAGLVLTLAVAASTHAAGRHAALPAPVDLAEDGRLAASGAQPVVILFSLAGCPYCDVVRQNYLLPLTRDLPERSRPVVREVQVNGSASFIGFNGERMSHQAFARQYGVRFAPTVILVDRNGKPLAAPIIGGDTAGLYGGYLDNAFAEATRKLANGRKFETSGE